MKKKIVLTPRDLEIFEFLGQHETATFEQIRAKFWPDSVTQQTARDRLDKLRLAGYIERTDYQPDPQRSTSRYQIKRPALRELPADRAAQLHTGRLENRAIDQAIKAVAARLEMEKQGYKIKEWISERRLQQDQQRQITTDRRAGRPAAAAPIADGQAVIADPATGEVSVIDVEIDGQYYGQMLDKKMRGLSANNRQVIWAATANRVNRIVGSVAATGSANVKVLEI